MGHSVRLVASVLVRLEYPIAAVAVGVLRARRGWEANASVLKAADDMMGTLIDILA